ncbi:hypothetical protein HAX54_031291, partial [Datura stramonium]|nr:hypothetical protein [Datura stramonium]
SDKMAEEPKKKRSLNLKVESESDDEEMAMFVRRFKKFLRKENSEKREEQRKNSKKQQQLESKAFKKAMKATWGETSNEELEGEYGENNLSLVAKVTQTQTTIPPSSKKEKIGLENVIKILNAEISNLEEEKTSTSEIIENDQGSLEVEINSLKRDLCKEKKKSSKLQETLNQENYNIALMKKWNKTYEALNWLNEHYNRARTGLGYKNKPLKWNHKRKYVGLAEYKLCSHCGHTGHVRYECLARIKALERNENAVRWIRKDLILKVFKRKGVELVWVTKSNPD